ncbi:hypothetical protein B0H14DRAFT_2603855 [Mycena olivaceomarginata]|nr:hypothetical protein B0H14DRAFT_2603855 [Mycena olivaceomarginata]
MSNPITGLLSVEKPSPKRRQALPEQKRRANCATSARYRERHREEYLEKERERAARRRVFEDAARWGRRAGAGSHSGSCGLRTVSSETKQGAEGIKERGTWVCSYSQTFYFWVWGCEYSVSEEFFTLRPKNKPQDCQRRSARDHRNPALPQDPLRETGCKGIEVDEALPNFQVGGLGGLEDIGNVMARPSLFLFLTTIPPVPQARRPPSTGLMAFMNPLPFYENILLCLKVRHRYVLMPALPRDSPIPFFPPTSIYLLVLSAPPSCPLSRSCNPLVMMTCQPPYYPCPGHESQTAHGNASSCQFYAVWAGRVRGVYSNSWIARADRRLHGCQPPWLQKMGRRRGWWRGLCREQHQGGCPAFEPVTFTLNPPNNTHPSSAACTRLIPAAVTVPAAAATRDGAHARSLPLRWRIVAGSCDPREDPEMYSLRGVSVFYTSHAAAMAAARSLGIEPKLMVVERGETAGVDDDEAVSLLLVMLVGVVGRVNRTEVENMDQIRTGLDPPCSTEITLWAKKPKKVAACEDDSDNDSNHTQEPKKRGQPSNFTGQRLAFLTENIPAYIAASKKKSGKEAKTEGLAPFWAQLFAVYWTRFPWDLPFDQDPDPDAKRELTPEEEAAKAKIQKDMKGPQAFNRHRNPRQPILRVLGTLSCERGGGSSQAHHRLQVLHAASRIPSAVMEAFTEKYSDQPKKMHVSLRCEVAKEMLAGEPGAHAEDVERYNESGDLEPDPDPATQRELARLHRAHPEYHRGRINEETQKFETMSANSGVVNGKLGAVSWKSSTWWMVARRPCPLRPRIPRCARAPPAAPVRPVAPTPPTQAQAQARAVGFLGMNLLQMSPEDDVDMGGGGAAVEETVVARRRRLQSLRTKMTGSWLPV